MEKKDILLKVFSHTFTHNNSFEFDIFKVLHLKWKDNIDFDKFIEECSTIVEKNSFKVKAINNYNYLTTLGDELFHQKVFDNFYNNLVTQFL